VSRGDEIAAIWELVRGVEMNPILEINIRERSLNNARWK